KILHRLLQDS
nr:Chain C, Nuclear receptor coactivator 2 [Homo sapiens]5G42_C Chain C, Rorg [Homo sapiens]5G45_C Chain C, Rorg [Homo sapiens]5G46_C Chain C, Rorg [Homo sapiens]